MIRSFRFRLTAWYAGLFAALLALFCAFCYHLMARSLASRIDDRLSSEANTAVSLLADELTEVNGDASRAAAETVREMRLEGSAVAVLRDGAVIAGTVLPPYMVTRGYDYPGSAFPPTFAGNGTPDDYPAYAFRMFVGGKGLFAFNPLLLFALAGAIAVALKREHPLRVEGLAVALGFVALCLYLATNTGNYGGMGYSERWYIVAVPTLFAFIFFAPPLNTAPTLNAATWKNPWWILFLPLLALSVLSSLQGVQAPWQDWLPPLQMTRSNQFPVFGLKWNVKFP